MGNEIFPTSNFKRHFKKSGEILGGIQYLTAHRIITGRIYHHGILLLIACLLMPPFRIIFTYTH